MKRDIRISNIKGLLIFLVVFGHLIAPYQEKFNAIYLFIYSFHMPLFVLISGYLAKKASYNKIINLLLLYIIFQFLYQGYITFIIPDHEFELSVEEPYYHLWYLVSMALWSMLVIVYYKTKLRDIDRKLLVAVCFIIGITSKFITVYVVSWMQNLSPAFDSYTLSYQRTLSFLPFFFLGLLLTEEKLEFLYRCLKNKWIPVLIIPAVIAYFIFADDTNQENILKGSYAVDQMKGSLLSTSGEILMGYLIALIMCLVILNLINNKRCIFTKWGDHSLSIFLFHIFITRYIKTFDNLNNISRLPLFALMSASAFIIVCVLSSDTFVNKTSFLSNPYQTIKSIFYKSSVLTH